MHLRVDDEMAAAWKARWEKENKQATHYEGCLNDHLRDQILVLLEDREELLKNLR